MSGSHGFRTPQFSEDAVWVPTWLQQCYFEILKVDDVEKDYVTFERRIEEFQNLGANIKNKESSSECGGCKISPLFLSGSHSSSFSFAQSADNVAKYHLHLSSDGSSEISTPVTDGVGTESNRHFAMLPLDDSKILGREARSPRKFHNSACETLVINEVIKNDSSVKSSTSATLEASVQIKQARLEVCDNAFRGPLDRISDIDDLSDLDDITMESAYEDTGIHLRELHKSELNASQVKDTLDSKYDEKIASSATGCSTSDDRSTDGVVGGVANDMQLTNNLAVECFDGGTEKKRTENLSFGLGFDDMEAHTECLKHVQALEEIADVAMNENNLIETNLGSSLNKSFHKSEKYHDSLHKIQDRFQSRWFGGWTWQHGGGQVFNTLQRLIQNLEVGRISIGVVVAEVENHASRHLRQCALENNVSMTSIYWIIRSLYAEQLIPLKEKRKANYLPAAIKIRMLHDPMELSPEI